MKKLICIAILLITFCTTAFSQWNGWNNVTGRSRFRDSMANDKLRNNALGDSVLTTDINGKFKNVLRGNSAPVTYYGVDSVTYVTANSTMCVWSFGIANCFVITTDAPIITTGVDSVVVTGTQLCTWTGGVSTCYTVSSTVNNNNYLTTIINNYNNPNCLSQIISGSLFLVGGFTFQNTDMVIEVGCQRYNVPASVFSIPSAAGEDFFVKVYADTSGNIGYIVGPSTPAGIPALTDPGSQVEIATYLVKVGSTTPDGLGTYPIYFEGTEWVFSSNISGADYLYTTNPYAGTYSLFIPATTAAWSKGYEFDGDTIPIANLTYFNFQIRLADTLQADDAISIGFRYGASFVSSGVSLKRGMFGLNGDKIDQWQPVAISKNLFTFQPNNTVLDGVTFIYGGSLPDIQFDNIQWQVGGSNTGGPVVIPPLVDTGRVTSDTAYYQYIDKRSGAVLFQLPTFVLHVYYDSCFIVDTVGRNVYISFNQNCGGSGGVGGSGIVELGESATLDKLNDSTYELKTVNSNVGTFGSASKTVTTTVNAKGLTTAISEQNIAITESQVTNLVSDLAGKLNISDTAAMLLPYRNAINRNTDSLISHNLRIIQLRDSVISHNTRINTKQDIITLTTTGTSGASTLIGATLNIPQYTGGGASATTVTEQKNYYNQEFYWNHGLNTSTGAFTSDVTKDITDYIPIEGSTSVTISFTDSTNKTIYGWTYDTTLTAISEIRSNALIGTTLKTYTFTTPSNARYLVLYTKAASDSFQNKLRIYSTNAITYNVPITPEQFSGSNDREKINAALRFARWTSSAVELKGRYNIDSAIIINSGNTLFLNGAKVYMNYGMHDNMIRNEAVKDPAWHIFNRGNKNIKIIGKGLAEFHGSTEAWGGDTQTGLGTQKWRMIKIPIVNVENFEVSGIKLSASHQWDIVTEQSRIGSINNIEILEAKERNNQCGVQIHRSSHGITVRDIRGVNLIDDIIAIENIRYNDLFNILGSDIYEPYRTNLDIYDIFISDINKGITNVTATIVGDQNFQTYSSSIRLLTADSFKIHDVHLSNINGIQEVLVQDQNTNYIVSVAPTVNDMYNIHMENIYAPVYLFRPIKNSTFTNVPKFDATGTYLTLKPRDGSLNIFRQYQGAPPEQIDSVLSSVEYRSYAADSINRNYSITQINKSAGTSAQNGFELRNNVGNKLTVGITGNSFSTVGLFTANTASIQAVTSTLLLTTSGSNPIQLSTNSTKRWEINTSGHFMAGTDNTYDIGASGATRPRNIYVAGQGIFGAGLTATSGQFSTSISATSGTFSSFVSATNITVGAGYSLLFPNTSGTNRDISIQTNNVVDNIGQAAFYPQTGTNVTASLAVIPRGTGRTATSKSQIGIYNTDQVANATDYEVAYLRATGTTGYGLVSAAAGSGTTVREIFIDATGTQSSATANMIFKVNRTLTAGGYGAGTLTTDASGNITATSDIRLKTNINPYKSGLKELMGIETITYRWNKKSGNETKGTYAGFSAQNVKANIPFGTGEMPDGSLTLQDRAVMATTVNSIQELYEMLLKQQSQIEDLKKEIKVLKAKQ